MSPRVERTESPPPDLERLRQVLAVALASNAFYTRKLTAAGITLESLPELNGIEALPFTAKAELAADQADHPPYGTNLSYPLRQYVRLHQTSGTSTGKPLRWLDTADSWDRMLAQWEMFLTDWKKLVPGQDRLFFAFSFGPFIGFWTAFEAASRAGFLCLPGGGMPTTTRLRFLLDNRATAVFATPTYALHLAEVAAAEGLDLAGSVVRAVVVAGEPGGCLSGTRERIERAWGARVFDQYGLTEIGPTASEHRDDPGNLIVPPGEIIAEVIEPNGERPTPTGELGELVLTNLWRPGSPLIRYRTGDLVREGPPLAGVPGRRLIGGVLGRTDDMIQVRGNNIYPSAIEAVVRRFPEIVEFRLIVDQSQQLADLRIEVEPTPAANARVAEAVGRAIRDDLLFRAEVVAVAPGTLPRFEMKARRVVKKA